jgi:hypothetical protein
VGVFGGATMNAHSASFRSLPTVPTCCVKNYGNISRIDYTIGMLIETPLVGILSFSGRAAYSPMNVQFFSQQNWSTIDINGVSARVRTEDTIITTLTALTLDAGIKVRIFANFAIELGVSSNLFPYAIARQIEKIDYQASGLQPIVDQSGKPVIERTIYEGTISGIQPQLRLYGGFEGDLPIIRRYPGDPVGIWSLGIFGRLYYPLTPINLQMSWSVSSLHVGMSLKARLPYLSMTPY